MKRKSVLLATVSALILTTALLLFTQVGQALTNRLTISLHTGKWEGVYYYPDNTPPVSFGGVLVFDQGKFFGIFKEPKTFGEYNTPFLYSDIEGDISNDYNIKFVKTYDGTGNVRHSVIYKGVLNPDTHIVKGTWTIPGAWSGTFEMHLLRGVQTWLEMAPTRTP